MTKKITGFFIIASAALALSTVSGCSQKKITIEPLLCYVGGTMRPAVEKLALLFEQKTGHKIQMDYSSSGEAIIKARQTGQGDLIVVHDPYLGAILKEGLGDKGWTVAELKATIVVQKGNPKNIKGLRDLLTPGMKIVLSDAQYSTLGNILAYSSEKHTFKDQLEANVVTRSRSSGDAANAVIMGNADAAVVWNAVAWLRKDKLDAVGIEPEYLPVSGVDAVTSATYGKIDMGKVRVTVARLAKSKQSKVAAEFAEFMISQEGEKVWLDLGFSKVSE